MLKNVPLKQLKHKDITIEGYSRAAVQTYWRVPEWKLGFDLGAHPWGFTATPIWFISHGHLDHIAALPLHLARRRMMKMEPPTIYMPTVCVEPFQQLLAALTRLDRGRLPCNLHGIEPGAEIEISREQVVTAVATCHTVPSLGYVVWERRKKLKPEYAELTGNQIREIRLSGVEVSAERRIPRLAYLGDSSIDGLDANPIFLEAEILILEMTFLAAGHRREKIRKFGHIHLDDLVERQEQFHNELVIAAHFSTRYGGQKIQQMVEKSLPDLLGGRLKLWV